MIKPSQPPQGARGKQHNRALPVGNAPLLPTAPPPEGEVLAALCLELLMSPKAERRVDFPLRGKYREAGIGVHFHQAQPGWHVFSSRQGRGCMVLSKEAAALFKRPPTAGLKGPSDV